MLRSSTERRLRQIADRLRHDSQELAVVDEQMAQLVDEADDARLRALVSETPLAVGEHIDAARHAEAMRKRRQELVASISELERRQDELLDQLTAERRKDSRG